MSNETEQTQPEQDSGAERASTTQEVVSTPETSTDSPATNALESRLTELEAERTRLQKDLESTRREAAKHRTEGNKQAEQLTQLTKAVAVALGLQAEAQPPDPAKLQQEVADLRGRYRTERIRNAYQASIHEEQADPELTWAYLTVKGQLDDLNTDDDTFAAEVRERIREAVKNQPRLKVTPTVVEVPKVDTKTVDVPTVTKSGAELQRAGSEQVLTLDAIKTWTPDQINAHWKEIAALLSKS
jgi:uncharacterized coiled-coil protein SlyX